MRDLKIEVTFLALLLAVLIIPNTGNAQQNDAMVPGNVIIPQSADVVKAPDAAMIYGPDNASDMPVYNPDEGAKIRTYSPLVDLQYNMPIYGYNIGKEVVATPVLIVPGLEKVCLSQCNDD